LKQATAFSNHTALQNGYKLYSAFFFFLLNNPSSGIAIVKLGKLLWEFKYI
jgi:hypothetical protein